MPARNARSSHNSAIFGAHRAALGLDVVASDFIVRSGAFGRLSAATLTPEAGPEARTASALSVPDNYQPVESAYYIPGPTALIDTYTAAPNTTGTLVVDDANHVMAALDTPGDQDWFKVTLTAGQTYQFGQYARAGGLPGVEGNGVPLADSYLEIYDSTGKLLANADGGGPNT
ncbi:MAG TPA: hypothetical protein VHM92_04010, partial [Allosphingosinicella sp.]|nr:hypothetical protein [Allosphingosinicella sp.]